LHYSAALANPSSSRARFRAAQVSSKRAQAQAKSAARRTALFTAADSENPSQRRQKESKDPRSADSTLAASSTVTDALRRTQRTLEQEVSRSRFAQEIFDQSNEELKQLSNQYTDLDSLLAASKGLVGSLLTSTKSDTWYLETTVWLLVVTCSWLVFRRLLYGPLWWLVWLPLKLLWKFSITTLGILGVFSSKEVQDLTNTQLNQTTSIMSAVNPEDHIPVEKQTFGAPVNTSTEGSALEGVGQMVDESKEEERYRGDGTKLEKTDAPRNPKKRVLNEVPTEMNNQDTIAAEKKDKDEL